MASHNNISSIVRNLNKLSTSPSAKTSSLKVLRQLGLIKPQKRAGTVAKLRKLLK